MFFSKSVGDLWSKNIFLILACVDKIFNKNVDFFFIIQLNPTPLPYTHKPKKTLTEVVNAFAWGTYSQYWAVIKKEEEEKKKCIRETPTLLTGADSRTDTILIFLCHFLLFFLLYCFVRLCYIFLYKDFFLRSKIFF